ncbi:MAG: hypothetical protein ACRDPO_15215, partial [Streptosporangiaceae bacterium]
DLAKPPGVAEAISWAGALHMLGAPSLDAAAAERTAGAVLKYAEDHRTVREAGFAVVVPDGAGAADGADSADGADGADSADSADRADGAHGPENGNGPGDADGGRGSGRAASAGGAGAGG